MPDSIGRISVPEVSPSGTFPLTTDYPHGREERPATAVHRFEGVNGKLEQRFLLGSGARRWFFRRGQNVKPSELKALRDFWEARQGPYQPFTYRAPGDTHAAALTDVTVRFDREPLSFEHLAADVAAGVTFVEVPSSAPSYTVAATVERFPDAGLETALSAQEHEMIPLLRIRVNEAAVSDVYVSDRRCTVGGQLYLERLLGFRQVNQSIGGQADDAIFELGNADGVMRAFAADTELRRARLEFSAYHVGSQTLINLWAGHVVGWEGELEPGFVLRGSDPVSALGAGYPVRRLGRRCVNKFDDGQFCPYATQGTGGDPAACDKGWNTANGCQAHGMDTYFRGVFAQPDRVTIKDNSTGFFGVGRKTLTPTSGVNETVFGQPLPEIWTDVSLEVQALLTAVRDESEFLDALGVVGEGPLTLAASGHRLDGRQNHGPGSLGLRLSAGNTPNPDVFGLTEKASDPADPTESRAAGTAFVELRRTDTKGLQPTEAQSHQMTVIVQQGLAGWKWASAVRSSQAGLANPVWVAVNVFLRALRLQLDSAANQAAHLDLAACEAAAALCDQSVTKLVGSGSETQFKFNGVIRDEKPLRDWLTEIFANCVGGWTFKFGKFRPFVRIDSAAAEAYTQGNIIWRSLKLASYDRDATLFRVHFAERLTDGLGLPVLRDDASAVYEDEDAAIAESPTGQPWYREKERGLSGTISRSQAVRIATVRGRELVGGVTETEKKRARRVAFETSVLGLSSEPGQVVSVTHPDAPGGALEMRVESWELLPDWSVIIRGRTTTDSMYDMLAGSTATDVEPDAIPGETDPVLTPANVTSFDAQEDPAGKVDPKTGQTLSRVTVSYTEPTPAASPSFQGTAIVVQEYDGTSEATPGAATEEPHEVTRIARNAAPEARGFDYPTTEKVLKVYGPSYGPNGVNGLADAPFDFVLLDGKQSAPASPANPDCQRVRGGLVISAERGAEADLDEALIAYTGDKTPWSLNPADAAIAPGQILGRVKIRPDTGDRWRWDYVETEYAGQSNGTVFTLDDGAPWAANQWRVETADGVFEGVNARVFPDGGGEAVDAAVVSNTANAVTFAGSSIPSGRVRLVFRPAAADALRFYCAHKDKSGNVSNWVFAGACDPYAADGTTDRDAPLVDTFGNPGLRVSYYTVGFTGLTSLTDVDRARQLSGWLGVRVRSYGETEAETDADLAKMYSIRGVHTAHVEVTYKKPGGTNKVKTFRLNWEGEGFQHSADRDPSGATDPGWYEDASLLIDLPGVEIVSVRVRLENAVALGPWATLFLQFAGTRTYTGDPAMQAQALTVSPAAAVTPETSTQGNWFDLTPNQATTINPPSANLYAGERVRYTIRNGNFLVTFGAGVTGVGNRTIPRNMRTEVELKRAGASWEVVFWDSF